MVFKNWTVSVTTSNILIVLPIILNINYSLEVKEMATPRRFERPTYALGKHRSILLSYGIVSRLECDNFPLRTTKKSKNPNLSNSFIEICFTLIF